MALEKCCFCCRLETGGTILGFLAAGLALISFILNVTSLSLPSGNAHYDELLQPVFGLFTGLSLIDLAAAAMLIIGIAKRNRNLLVPWLILRSISLILLSPIAICLFIISFPFGFPYYLWYCVYSLFHTMPIMDDSSNGNSSVVHHHHRSHMIESNHRNRNDGEILLPAYSKMDQ